MNILQISAPKSGSFWLNTILKTTLEYNNIPVTSFIKSRSEYEDLKKQKLSFKDQAGTDMIDIENEGIFFRVSSLLKKPIPDLQEYVQKSSLTWTHSTYCENTEQVFKVFDRKICIVRDPRDTALSAARFAFTPYMLTHYPSSYRSVEEFFSGEYERLMRQWVWFYGNYLLHKDKLDLHFVFYENLLKDFENEYNGLLDYLQVRLRPEAQRSIAHEVSFSTMKKESPRHLQKGQSQRWVERFSSIESDRTLEIAGDLMELFGYPLEEQEGQSLPSLPEHISDPDLEKILARINWRELY